MKKREIRVLRIAEMGLLLFALLFFSSCGVYSKVPPVTPTETPLWSGSLVEEADMQSVRIYIKPNLRSITLNMEDIDGDLRLLLTEYDEAKIESTDTLIVEELSVKIPQSGTYVLVIEKTKP